MNRHLPILVALALLLALAAGAQARPATTPSLPSLDHYVPARSASGDYYVSTGSSGALGKAEPDSFYLYGGPASLEGKFQDPTGAVCDPQGWIGADLTDFPTQWQHTTYNMENLNAHGPGNQGMWCGQRCDQVSGWAHCPGYGNGWFAILSFEAPYLGDPSLGQTVELDFYFNHDTEPGYDYLEVYYDSAGSWVRVYMIDASNKEEVGGDIVYPSPGVRYALEPGRDPILYVGEDYGQDSDRIALRLVVFSDTYWSDQDGDWITDAGAAQVDDITVVYQDGVTKSPVTRFEDFEGSAPFLWNPLKAPFVGDFMKLYARISDLDPCRENPTPAVTFLDDGTPPSNPDNDPPMSTGGSTSATWSYGVPGGWVVNYTGGLSFGAMELRNEAWSPPFEWDLPETTADDSPFFAGSELRYTVYRHLPLDNGIFYLWHVSYSTDGGGSWTPWDDHWGIYYGTERTGDWFRDRENTSTLIGADPETGDPVTHVRVALAAWDIAEAYDLLGADSTPGPIFDDVSFLKYRVDGPAIGMAGWNLLQDAFPPTGSIDVGTLAARDALDCRVDSADEIGWDTTPMVIRADSVVAMVKPIIPGTTTGPNNLMLRWRMDVNPLFEMSIRENLQQSGTLVGAGGTAHNGWNQYEGALAAERCTTAQGGMIEDTYFWDLPDEDFAYPGDVLYYYLEATDAGVNGGNTSRLPRDLAGFGTPDYNRAFTVRFLPSLVYDQSPPYVLPESGGAVRQPGILLINDFGHRGGEDDFLMAFQQNGYVEGSDWDTYTVRNPDSYLSNGIGASGAGGASANQLADYSSILYVCGDLSGDNLSDGTNVNGNDKANDLETLSQWHELPGDRCAAYFGDDFASSTQASGGAGAVFAATILNVVVADGDVRDEIGDQTAPTVVPVHPSFAQRFVAYGGCPMVNTFDSILPGTGAMVGHRFLDRLGNPYSNVAASVIHERIDGDGDRIVDITFPYGFCYLWNETAKGEASARSLLLREILDYFGTYPGGPAVGQDPIVQRGIHDLSSVPNPFNPITTVRFTLGARSLTTVRVYNLRGELVATLAREVMDAGAQTVTWNGVDERGASVASGVYVIRVEGDGASESKKVALVK